MGFLKKIGKGLKKSVGGLVKMASIKNVKKLASGDYQSVVSEAMGRTTDAIQKNIIGEFTKKTVGKSPAPATMQNMSGETVKGVKLNEVLQAGLGGLLTGAGLSLSNDQTTAEQMANAGDNVAMAWLKKNWLKAVGIVAGIVMIGFVLVKALKGANSGKRKAFRN